MGRNIHPPLYSRMARFCMTCHARGSPRPRSNLPANLILFHVRRSKEVNPSQRDFRTIRSELRVKAAVASSANTVLVLRALRLAESLNILL
jgi:hypothetical protein